MISLQGKKNIEDARINQKETRMVRIAKIKTDLKWHSWRKFRANFEIKKTHVAPSNSNDERKRWGTGTLSVQKYAK